MIQQKEISRTNAKNLQKKKVPQEWSQLMKMTRLHPSIQKLLWMEGIFFIEYFGKDRRTKK